MAQPTEPTDSSEPGEAETVEPTAPVSATEHVGVDPVVPSRSSRSRSSRSPPSRSWPSRS